MWAAQAILGRVHVLDYTTPPQATYTMEQWDSLFVLEANKDCDKGFAAEKQRVSFNGADGLLSVTRCERSAGLPILTVRNTVPRKGGGFYHVDFWPDLRTNLTLDQADALIRDLRGKVIEAMLAR
jgi:hypothetical protein